MLKLGWIASWVTWVLLVSVCVPSEGAMRMRIENLGMGQGVVVTDNGAGDLNPLAGAITVSQAIPGGFAVSVNTGISDPPVVQPPAGDQSLDLNSVTVQTTGAAILRIILENDGFLGSGGPGLFSASLGGVLTAPAGSTATFQSSVNPTNAVPTLGPDISPAGALGAVVFPGGSIGSAFAFGPGAFAGSTGPTPFVTGPLNSLYLEATISFTGAGSVSFDTFASFVDQGAPGVPLPAALYAGLVMGAGVLLRRR